MKPNPVAPDGYSWCGKCKQFLPKENFGPNKKRSNGLKCWCLTCSKQVHNAWRRSNGIRSWEEYSNDRKKTGQCFDCGVVTELWVYGSRKKQTEVHVCKPCGQKRNIRDWWLRKTADTEWHANRKADVRAAMRNRRKNPIEGIKMAARTMVSAAVKAGILVRQPCEQCGFEPAEADHRNYAQPLKVSWLCREHHGLLKKLPAIIEP